MVDASSIPGLGRSPGEGIGYPFQYPWASLVAQMVKNLPTMWETWVQSLGWEDPLEEGTATHFSILARRIPRAEEPGELTVHWLAESDTTVLGLGCCKGFSLVAARRGYRPHYIFPNPTQ